MRIRAFIYATEDSNRVIRGMRRILRDAELRIEIAEGAYGDRIEIAAMKTSGSDEIKELFRSMKKKDILQIIETLDERIDENGILHFRLDKQALYLGKTVLSDGGDVVAVEIKIKSYPFNKNKVIESMRKYLGGML